MPDVHAAQRPHWGLPRSINFSYNKIILKIRGDFDGKELRILLCNLLNHLQEGQGLAGRTKDIIQLS